MAEKLAEVGAALMPYPCFGEETTSTTCLEYTYGEVDVLAKAHLREALQTCIGIKGDTATNSLKPATLETGVEIRVPLFVNEGDLVQVDTRDGSYLQRVKE